MVNKATNATKQASQKAGKGGIVPPVDRRFGGKNANPRHNGAWAKKDTLRFKIEQASYLNNDELQAIADDPEEATLLRKFAKATLKADWKMIKEITEMLYGKPKESVDVTTQGESINPYAALTTDELRKLAGK